MEKTLLTIELIGAICGLIPTIVTIFLLVKNIIRNKNWELAQNIIRSAMTEIEKYAQEHPEMSSEDKFTMAMKAIEAGLTAAEIKLDVTLVERIKAYIEEMCKWSKTINTKN